MDLKRYVFLDGEEPLDNICQDGGFCSIFRTIGCIGDSLSSGEFESTNEDCTAIGYHDMYEYSWGQYMARRIGSTVYNFSCGGMCAKQFMSGFGQAVGCFDDSKLCQAYIIALGVNDIINYGQEIGCASDIDLGSLENNKDTFCGWYGKIIQRVKEKQPDAKIFLVTAPRDDMPHDELKEKHRDAVIEISKMFSNTYVIDLYKYAPVFDVEFKKRFYLMSHLNPMGYKLNADMIMSYIDYIIRKYPEDFCQVGFIGRGVHNYTAKW